MKQNSRQNSFRVWLVLVLFLMVTDVIQGQFRFATNNGAITIMGYSGPGGAVVIPGTTNGLPVTSIGDGAFQSCPLSSVTIPDSVTSIGDGAFEACLSLTTVNIPDNVSYFGSAAFHYCTGLTNAMIGSSVAKIGDAGFQDCTNLTGVYFRSNAPALGSSVFYNDNIATVYYLPGTAGWGPTFGGCPTALWYLPAPYTCLTNNGAITITGYTGTGGAVAIPDTITGLPVTGIGASAFYFRSGVTSVTIPDTVTNIGDSAFAFCPSLTNVTVGKGLNSIGSDAFWGCTNLAGVYFQGNAPGLGSDVFYNDNNATVYYLTGTTGWGATFGGRPTMLLPFTYATLNGTITITTYDCSGGAVTIPDTINGLPVTAILSWAFASCTRLTGITIPDSVASIGGSAFYGCINLASVKIGNGVTNIAGSAFYNCRSLTNLTIGSGVTSIQDSAFYYCIKLTSLTIPNSVASLGYAAFSTCVSLTNVTISTNLTSLGSFAFYYCTSLGNVTIPDSVTSISAQAFDNCSSLTNLTIGKGVSYLGDYAFNCGQGLRAVFFRGNVPNNQGFSPFYSAVSSTIYYLPGTTGWGATYADRPAVLWNPQIQINDRSFGVRTNQFGFNITGTANIPIRLDACTNPGSPVWAPLLSCTLTNGSAYFSDPQWGNYPTRFYRIRSP